MFRNRVTASSPATGQPPAPVVQWIDPGYQDVTGRSALLENVLEGEAKSQEEHLYL